MGESQQAPTLIGDHRVIIAGSRTGVTRSDVDAAMASYVEAHGIPTQIIHGGAIGADWLGHDWARDNRIPVLVMPADWETHGRKAGPIRNRAMADCARGLVAIWNGESRGTADMIRCAERLRLHVYVFRVNGGHK